MIFFKRIVCSLMLVLFMLSSTKVVYANNVSKEYVGLLDVESFYQTVLKSKGFSGTYQTLNLYNENDLIQWCMYFDDTTYLILDKGTGEVMEYGFDCQQPFSNYKNYKPYYGGPLCYYIKLDEKYFGIIEKKYYSKSPKVSGVVISEKEVESVLRNKLSARAEQPIEVAASLVKSVSVLSPLSIQRQAFGNNVNGTCSAVATGIVLTYLNRNKTAWYVPDSTYMSENLIGKTYLSTSYAKAEKLHQLLITSGMGTASYADRIKLPVSSYKSQYLPNTVISVDWRMIRSNPTYITDQIDKNIPGMITTTLFTGGFDWHTMAVYGYNYYSDNTYDFLVHTGWYSSVVFDEKLGYIMPKI